MTDRPNHAEIVEQLRADAAALEDMAGEPCIGSVLLTEAAALIEALAERVRELEGALEGVVSRPHWTDGSLTNGDTIIDVTMTFAAFARARQARKDQDNG
jgi:hypothetical protein